MRDRYATGDFTGALVVAEALLEANPNNEEAQRCHERCTETLSQMYMAHDLDAISAYKRPEGAPNREVGRI